MSAFFGESLAWFAWRMACELDTNQSKSGWYDMTLKQLLQRLRQETAELAAAIARDGTSDDVVREAADVANFAMMIADNVRALRGGDHE